MMSRRKLSEDPVGPPRKEPSNSGERVYGDYDTHEGQTHGESGAGARQVNDPCPPRGPQGFCTLEAGSISPALCRWQREGA